MNIRHIGNWYWHTHGQDLKREDNDNRTSINVRGWLYLYRGNPDTDGRKVIELNYQFVVNRAARYESTALLTVGDGDGADGILLSLGAFGVRLHVGAEGVLPDRLQPRVPGRSYPEEHQLGLRIFDGSIWWSLWSTPDEWDSRANWRDPRSCVRQPVWHVVDRVLGEMKIAKRELGTASAEIVHNGVTYPLTIAFTEHSYTRPRWFGKQVYYRANIEMSKPIPVPASEGIYELTGDPDDAIYSLSTNARTVDEAIAALRVSLERD
jgi:hypothetical protein